MKYTIDQSCHFFVSLPNNFHATQLNINQGIIQFEVE